VQLPLRPSLSHLRKQAKDLLRRLRQQDPDATLADAQHALARQYDFDSWPKLKVQVELLAKLIVRSELGAAQLLPSAESNRRAVRGLANDEASNLDAAAAAPLAPDPRAGSGDLRKPCSHDRRARLSARMDDHDFLIP
jgi:hypothetical protein